MVPGHAALQGGIFIGLGDATEQVVADHRDGTRDLGRSIAGEHQPGRQECGYCDLARRHDRLLVEWKALPGLAYCAFPPGPASPCPAWVPTGALWRLDRSSPFPSVLSIASALRVPRPGKSAARVGEGRTPGSPPGAGSMDDAFRGWTRCFAPCPHPAFHP